MAEENIKHPERDDVKKEKEYLQEQISIVPLIRMTL